MNAQSNNESDMLGTTVSALHQAESDKLFDKRLALLFSDASTAPPHLARKELALARVRVRKAELIEKCQVQQSLSRILAMSSWIMLNCDAPL